MLRMLLNEFHKRRQRKRREHVLQAVARDANVIDIVPRLAAKREKTAAANSVTVTPLPRCNEQQDFSYRSTPQF